MAYFRCLASTLLAVGFAVLPALGDQTTASGGGVKAVLTFERQPGMPTLDFNRIQITRKGVVAFAGPLPAQFDQGYADASPVQPLLSVRELDEDSEPEVIVQSYSGGAHCCFGAIVYSFNPRTRSYRVVARNFLDSGFRLQALGDLAALQFSSADARFGYAFASFAESGMPVQLWRYSSGDLVDVTRCYPALIRADADKFWAAAVDDQETGAAVTGVLAAYAADQYMLSSGQQALRRIKSSGFRGISADYVSKLSAFLTEMGYTGGSGIACSAAAQ
jgi:hypothetical protein